MKYFIYLVFLDEKFRHLYLLNLEYWWLCKIRNSGCLVMKWGIWAIKCVRWGILTVGCVRLERLGIGCVRWRNLAPWFVDEVFCLWSVLDKEVLQFGVLDIGSVGWDNLLCGLLDEEFQPFGLEFWILIIYILIYLY